MTGFIVVAAIFGLLALVLVGDWYLAERAKARLNAGHVPGERYDPSTDPALNEALMMSQANATRNTLSGFNGAI